MLTVLTSVSDVAIATQRLQTRGCGYHADPFKNWDLSLIAELVASLDRSAPILDVGCGESRCSVLNFLSNMGFTNLTGVDLNINLPDRIEQFLAMRNRGAYRPLYRLRRADATRTGFAGNAFECVVCVSTIEHGVDLKAFFSEMARILRPGGKLFVTTDYWPEPIDVGGRTAWGLPWHIFSHNDIQTLVSLARSSGLLTSGTDVPAPQERTVAWGGAQYTFLALTFQKAVGQ